MLGAGDAGNRVRGQPTLAGTGCPVWPWRVADRKVRRQLASGYGHRTMPMENPVVARPLRLPERAEGCRRLRASTVRGAADDRYPYEAKSDWAAGARPNGAKWRCSAEGSATVTNSRRAAAPRAPQARRARNGGRARRGDRQGAQFCGKTAGSPRDFPARRPPRGPRAGAPAATARETV